MEKQEKKFKCIGLEESFCTSWADGVEFGLVYKEVNKDCFGENLVNESAELGEDIHLIINKQGVPLYVDADQFKEIFDDKPERAPEDVLLIGLKLSEL